MDRSKALEEYYKSFEATLRVSNLSYGSLRFLSTFNGNKALPVHRWFTYKEGFSAGLFDWVAEKTGLATSSEPLSLLDPFCGVGTSLLSAQLSSIARPKCLTGFEINPFVSWVANTKLNWHTYNQKMIRQQADAILNEASLKTRLANNVPSLSTLNNPKYFPIETLNSLLALRRAIFECSTYPETNFLLLGWSAIIEEVSNLRKDGRALRYEPKSDAKPILERLRMKWDGMLSDLVYLKENAFLSLDLESIEAEILVGDGRSLAMLNSGETEYDLILYSPPYPNNIDYTEVYKLELWLNNYVNEAQEFRELRRKTFRSHPSVRFGDSEGVSNFDQSLPAYRMLDMILNAIPHDHQEVWRRRLYRQYVEDIYLSLMSQYAHARKGGFVVCVVGNSVHGKKASSFCIAADLIIAALAQEIGFDVLELVITREFTRRDPSPLNRESILILQKGT